MEKYLVFDKGIKQFLTSEDDLVCYDMLENGVVEFEYGEYIGLELLEESDYEFYQSTTVTDFNGNEIYEGYIIEFDDTTVYDSYFENYDELYKNRAVVNIDPVNGIYLNNFMKKDSITESEFSNMDKLSFLNDSKIVGHICTDIELLEV